MALTSTISCRRPFEIHKVSHNYRARSILFIPILREIPVISRRPAVQREFLKTVGQESYARWKKKSLYYGENKLHVNYKKAVDIFSD